MAINTAHYNGGILIFSGEYILLYCDCVEIKFEELNKDERFAGCKRGRLYLTSHRMVFNNLNVYDKMQSLTFPFFQLSNVSLEQPAFGCNYIKGRLKSQPNTVDMHIESWVGATKFRIFFRSGGAIDFGMAMLQAAKMASQNVSREPPPPYVPPIQPFYQAPHEAYMPPQGTFGLVLPTHVFPNYPACNAVFTTAQPPPYPGVCVNPPTPYGPCPPPVRHMNAPHMHPIQQQHCHSYQVCCAGADSPQPSAPDMKAREAAGSQEAYYNPSNPHMAYVPPQAPPYSAQQYPNAQPPSYDEATKKMN
uniref:GRAM domain-containing protein n=1 Tax=Strigamia maritima TaxID=126957 RepID=T1JIP7_STRMM